jgi:ribosomal-protein-serine acetyltransferase
VVGHAGTMGPRWPVELRTGDVVIRTWRADDARALGEAIGDSLDHLRPWMPWIASEPLPRSERRAMLRRWSAQSGPDEDHLFGIFHDGAVVGGCGIHNRIGPGVREIGYWVRRGWTRQGIATRAARELTSYALAMSGVARVEIHHDRANVASAGVPRGLGYTFAGESAEQIDAPGESGINCRWQMTPAAWATRNRL